MDIQETIDIRYEEIEGLKQNLSEDHYMNPEQEDELEELITKAIKFGELCAKRDAKAQAVPDVQQALNDRLLVRSIKEQVESHIAEISVNDLFDKGWFAAMKCIQSNIDMLEAREPTND